jgi:hypothetical protein
LTHRGEKFFFLGELGIGELGGNHLLGHCQKDALWAKGLTSFGPDILKNFLF